jgi:WD40 repeat protein
MKVAQPASVRRQMVRQRAGIIAAVVFLALLVGSMAVVLNFAHHGTGNTTGLVPATTKAAATSAVPQATPTGTPGIPQVGDIGKVVYTSPSTQSFYGATWSPDSQRLAVVDDQGIQAWDATTGKHVVVYVPAVTSGCQLSALVAWSPDGTRIAAGTDAVGIWDTSSGKLLATYPHTTGNSTTINEGCSGMSSIMEPALKGNHNSSTGVVIPLAGYIPVPGGNPPLLSLAWSPDGKEIALSFGQGIGGSTIQIWDTTTGNLVKTYHDTSYVVSIAWSPNGKYFAFGSYDQTVQVWNAATWQPIMRYTGNNSQINTLAWSPDSTRIISAGNNVTEWNALTGKTLLELPGNANGIYAVAWSPDGSEIATVNNHVQIWNATSGKAVYTFRANPYPVDRIAWSPNGKYIASVSSRPGPTGGKSIVQVWIA